MGFSEDEVRQLIEKMFPNSSEETKAEIFEQITSNFGGYDLTNKSNSQFFDNLRIIQYL